MKLIKNLYIIFINLSRLLSRKNLYPFLNEQLSTKKENSYLLTSEYLLSNKILLSVSK